jgi:hypothetical protein
MDAAPVKRLIGGKVVSATTARVANGVSVGTLQALTAKPANRMKDRSIIVA